MRFSIRRIFTLIWIGLIWSCQTQDAPSHKRINILFAISDDQSWVHTSAAGCSFVKTPAFDRIARRGVLFANAYGGAPQCSPNRAVILTGRNIWELEEAGTHSSYFPRTYPVFTQLLDTAGYHVGFTGKGWGPGNYEDMGWPQNPAGKRYDLNELDPGWSGINRTDYFENFKSFMEQRKQDEPFFFWYGAFEPHRAYDYGSGQKEGKDPEKVDVPAFLPDNSVVRNDLLDYSLEIEWFDAHLLRMLSFLDSLGELDHTMVVVTSDNGMPFPRAKANLYEYGIHMPMAIWIPGMQRQSVSSDLFGFVDLAPTFLEVAGVDIPKSVRGNSFMAYLMGNAETPNRAVYFGRERHTHARIDNLGYPSRAIRSQEYLYIRNFTPERTPAGDGPIEGFPEGYYDIDGSPSKDEILNEGNEAFMRLSVSLRPEEELYDVLADPDCLVNLSDSLPEIKERLASALTERLVRDQDPRIIGSGDVFDSYPRHAPMRSFPGFKQRGEYNADYQ